MSLRYLLNDVSLNELSNSLNAASSGAAVIAEVREDATRHALLGAVHAARTKRFGLVYTDAGEAGKSNVERKPSIGCSIARHVKQRIFRLESDLSGQRNG